MIQLRVLTGFLVCALATQSASALDIIASLTWTSTQVGGTHLVKLRWDDVFVGFDELQGGKLQYPQGVNKDWVALEVNRPTFPVVEEIYGAGTAYSKDCGIWQALTEGTFVGEPGVSDITAFAFEVEFIFYAECL